ncbi:hypothetical protein N7447_008591 [Penicillium robsamsonii]|uniref:uncharacterized protein n=1 Tax=Penicillium robsamsonii TaxID=1792511 RepID=UPI0025474388|nr:uncharacterized protein N7447_008591 [Penicillium robsamsonii]KAJ5816358.1 hypothetical protein N7447_008591 [Penicillium robsamsonii]
MFVWGRPTLGKAAGIHGLMYHVIHRCFFRLLPSSHLAKVLGVKKTVKTRGTPSTEQLFMSSDIGAVGLHQDEGGGMVCLDAPQSSAFTTVAHGGNDENREP